jgi:hypothetical protein
MYNMSDINMKRIKNVVIIDSIIVVSWQYGAAIIGWWGWQWW